MSAWPAMALPAEEPLPEYLTRPELQRLQCEKLRALLQLARAQNPFYRRKWEGLDMPEAGEDARALLQLLPFTTKAELLADQQAAPPYGTNLTFPPEHYFRCHQTSGSTGATLRWPDTRESWLAMLDAWAQIFRAAQVTPRDRLFFAFSFGPFIGFWSAFEAAERLGCFCFPGGAMNSEARLRALLDNHCTVLLCTPTYALHLGQEARAAGLDLAASRIRLIITAGEPGGSVPAVRARLSSLWNGARVFDHHGMTETGPVTYECPARPGVLHVMENLFVAEVVDPATGQPGVTEGELVLTTLNRVGSPAIRYRTGDRVRVAPEGVCACGRHLLALEGGIIGRADDMVIVRGVNVYPAAVDNLIRGFKDVAEYRVHLVQSGALPELLVEIEPAPGVLYPETLAQRLRCAFHTALGLRVPVRLAAPGTLPRFEMKSRRWVKTLGEPLTSGESPDKFPVFPV
ncbi:MAG: AMP-binding protein [Verrucomicrobiae bacterium]|nr:AMP-binding protein [Verrucomicrobiae bacterium]